MSGWNGSGTFDLPYSMVAEALAGVKILASHQDTQWLSVKQGLENCQTRDGQNSPTADIDWGGNRITGLADPVSDTDAANKEYVDLTGTTAWKLEQGAVAWVAANSFMVSAIDRTARYAAGRRVKILHNNGASTAYATVRSSAFAANTTVLVSVDNNTVLLAPITTVYYGMEEYANPAYLDPRSRVIAYTASDLAVPATTFTTLTLSQELIDSLGEWDTGTYTFTAQKAGLYLATLMLVFRQTGAGKMGLFAHIYLNGNIQAFNEFATDLTWGAVSPPTTITLPVVTVLNLAAGDAVQFKCFSSFAGVAAEAPNGQDGTHATISRII